MVSRIVKVSDLFKDDIWNCTEMEFSINDKIPITHCIHDKSTIDTEATLCAEFFLVMNDEVSIRRLIFGSCYIIPEYHLFIYSKWSSCRGFTVVIEMREISDRHRGDIERKVLDTIFEYVSSLGDPEAIYHFRRYFYTDLGKDLVGTHEVEM